MSLTMLHRSLAVFLLIFVVSHLGVHLTALTGPQMHQLALGAVQRIYRNWLVEPVLVAALLSQIFVGVRLALRRLRAGQSGLMGKLQIASGFYLAFFILIHTGAALSTRHLFGLDTNFYWAAGTVTIAPLKYGFWPYYTLAVMAIFTHVAAFIWFRWQNRVAAAASLIVGAVTVILILLPLSGALYDINLPTEYQRYYDSYAN